MNKWNNSEELPLSASTGNSANVRSIGYRTLQEEEHHDNSLNGDSRHGLYATSKKDLYEQGPVAQCSKAQAIALTVFVFTALFLTSLAAAFVKPFNIECPVEEIAEVEVPSDEPELVATNGEEFPWDDIRLPSFITPIRYDIELTPNLTTHWVKGIEKLIFTVKEETNFIVFHSKNITITSRTMNERLNVERMLEYPFREQIYLETDEYMVPGVSYAIRLKFQYKLSKHLEGFYLSRYNNEAGEQRFLATSHFEPTYARRAFPCFDEPDLKAKFLMTITHDTEYSAFFNTPKKAVTEVRGKNNLIRDEFEETVDMSTYLVAFVVCDFAQVHSITQKGVNVSVIAAPHKIGQAQFALESATKIMDYYDEFFGIPYPLPKEDLIAIPDFGAGAMENWGLITYRETSLLYSETQTSADAKQWIAVVVAHELAHQWFGDLVTMKWWNDLWLNEGFASWMEYLGVDHIHPEWRMMDQFFLDMVAPALALDSLTTSHPISVDVKDPKEIEAIFDTISYKKGAAIIHMLEDLVGEKTIRDGLTHYLKEHKFDNAETNDLWDAISRSWDSGKYDFTVKEMMDTWTLQMGYPLITFDQQNDTNIYTIRQERFLKSMNVNDTEIQERRHEQDDYQWVVPLTFHTDLEDFPTHKFILNKSQTMDFEFPGDMTWFKANLNGTGFYRVNYPASNWDALILALNTDHRVFTPADRAQLINDAFALAQAGLLPSTKPLDMIMYLLKENEIVPWATALRHLSAWKVTLQETDLIPLINNFIQTLISPIYNKVGWGETGEHMERLLRKLILRTALDADMEEAQEKAVKYFHDYKNKNESVPPNLKAVAYSAGVKFGGLDEWKFAWTMFKESHIPSEKSIWMRALANSPHPYILQQYLDATLDRQKIKPQDVTSVLAGVARNPAGANLAWRHVQMHWDEILSNFGVGSFIIGSIIESTTSHFSTEFDYEQVQDFFIPRRTHIGSGQRALDQSEEQIQINIEWRRDHEEEIRRWMQAKVGASAKIF
ncbi:endoplasmic reticulum aminopeptidase 1-like isoform X1 [Tigriopus californicus]|uniref:endoplasmic reticulum aminopeptidase 1-like isoform X1 n=1 Tax=Tigriopus californicus TaxID=6832 RepID=UPI0027DA831D|nr:endoplasmic reticulum aminopeptidase 1-like isoform X1 [Tigriopus californicus]